MFKFLTNLFAGRRKKETEIKRLKEERDEALEECKTAALGGDQEATLRLRDYEQTVADQSVRLLRGAGKKAALPLALIVLALGVEGCVTRSTTTEGDREVLYQTRGAAEASQAHIEAAKSAVDGGQAGEAKLHLDAAADATRDARENMRQQLAVHGPPAEPAIYSPANSKAARDKSNKEHSDNTLLKVALAVAGVAFTVGTTLCGMPWLAKTFPALTGKIGTWAKTGSNILTEVRARAEDNGGNIHISDILAIAKRQNVTAGVQDLVTSHVDAHEEEMGHEFDIKLAAPPDPTAAPPPAPAVP